ncbi:MAG: HAD-IIIC family phosphatase, partial [Candidatus Omnitrophica bacterium]|nr:HAD-IIIC family phosphatase [Candidatus Omnitrophota bacterium]
PSFEQEKQGNTTYGWRLNVIETIEQVFVSLGGDAIFLDVPENHRFEELCEEKGIVSDRVKGRPFERNYAQPSEKYKRNRLPNELVEQIIYKPEHPSLFNYWIWEIPKTGSSSPVSVLVVDDRENERQIVIDTLNNIKDSVRNIILKIDSASDGREALSKMRERSYDMLITDISMPLGMDGMTLIRTVRFLNPGIFILAMSGQEAYCNDAIKVGADDFIVKPFVNLLVGLDLYKYLKETLELITAAMPRDVSFSRASSPTSVSSPLIEPGKLPIKYVFIADNDETMLDVTIQSFANLRGENLPIIAFGGSDNLVETTVKMKRGYSWDLVIINACAFGESTKPLIAEIKRLYPRTAVLVIVEDKKSEKGFQGLGANGFIRENSFVDDFFFNIPAILGLEKSSSPVNENIQPLRLALNSAFDSPSVAGGGQIAAAALTFLTASASGASSPVEVFPNLERAVFPLVVPQEKHLKYLGESQYKYEIQSDGSTEPFHLGQPVILTKGEKAIDFAEREAVLSELFERIRSHHNIPKQFTLFITSDREALKNDEYIESSQGRIIWDRNVYISRVGFNKYDDRSADYPKNTLVIHPYFFELERARQLEIIFYQVIATISKECSKDDALLMTVYQVIFDDGCKAEFNELRKNYFEVKEEDIERVRKEIDYDTESGVEIRLFDYLYDETANYISKAIFNLNTRDHLRIKEMLKYFSLVKAYLKERNCDPNSFMRILSELSMALPGTEDFLEAVFIEFTLYDLELGIYSPVRFEEYCTLHGTTFHTWPVFDLKFIKKSVFSRYREITMAENLPALVREFARGLRESPELLKSQGLDAYLSGLKEKFAVSQKHKQGMGPSGIKCIAVDCDGVLWKGILDEGQGITMTEAHWVFQKALKELKNSGYLLAICSKNDAFTVEAILECDPDMLLRKDDFALIKANWKDKAGNLREIAQELNIGLDSLLFLDDSPHERELARSGCPEVLIPDLPEDPAEWVRIISDLTSHGQKFITNEDQRRTELYGAKRKRDELRQKAGTLEGYYGLLEMRIIIRKGSENRPYIERLAQLSQRTNQFNLVTRRYGPEQIEEFINNVSGTMEVYSLELIDKFGNAGIVGLLVLERLHGNVLKIREFCLSCRAIGLTVEQAFMACVVRSARKSFGSNFELIGIYRSTKKNALVKDIYANMGFYEASRYGDLSEWELNKDTSPEVPEWITVIDKFIPRVFPVDMSSRDLAEEWFLSAEKQRLSNDLLKSSWQELSLVYPEETLRKLVVLEINYLGLDTELVVVSGEYLTKHDITCGSLNEELAVLHEEGFIVLRVRYIKTGYDEIDAYRTDTVHYYEIDYALPGKAISRHRAVPLNRYLKGKPNIEQAYKVCIEEAKLNLLVPGYDYNNQTNKLNEELKGILSQVASSSPVSGDVQQDFVKIVKNVVTINRHGKKWVFILSILFPGDKITRIILNWATSGEYLMMYGLSIAGKEELALRGVHITDFLRGEALLRPLLNIFLSLYPDTTETNPEMTIIPLLALLAREYVFAPEKQIQPNAWFRFATLQERAEQKHEFVLFLQEEELIMKLPNSILARSDLTVGREPDSDGEKFEPLYLGYPLILQDRTKFKEAQAAIPIEIISAPIRGVKLGFVPGGSSPIKENNQQRYADKINTLLAKTKNMPAYELLRALDLYNAELLRIKQDKSGLEIYSIRVPKRKDYTRLPLGIEILENELASTREFELLFNPQGYLIAIFPMVTYKLTNKAEGGSYYFDFTAYYFEIPAFSDAGARAQWEDFTLRRNSDEGLIRIYMLSENLEDIVQEFPNQGQKPYVFAELIELPVAPGDTMILPRLFQFEPEEIMVNKDDFLPIKRLFDTKITNPRIVFQVFPTVYSP